VGLSRNHPHRRLRSQEDGRPLPYAPCPGEKGKEGAPKRLNGEWVRNEIRKPNRVLLLLYFLNPLGAGLNITSNPIVGFAVSFPGTDRDDAVTYAVHSQLLNNFDMEDLFETVEDDNDED